jgi:hypothetical protein
VADLGLADVVGEVALHCVGEGWLGGGEELLSLRGERSVHGPPV